MIKFFRKIRQKLLSEGKTEKYFKYAIGEIILVVIGILIALSINNWNQNITFKNELNQIIKDIQNDLNQDILILDEEIQNSERFINNVDNLLDNANKMPIDSLLSNLSKVHSVSFFVPVNFGYNKLNRHPRTELLPDSLTINLTTYYITFSKESSNINYQGLSLYSLNLFRNYLVKNGFPLEFRKLERPEELSNLRLIVNDIEFIGILRNTKHNKSVELSTLIEARKQVENNLLIINNYLLSIN
ncbi:DUF6090 family protein [Winogradskyella sp. R77965]|uniref:DUF6090 family protein n=1 Tax=Winogradskyella sp. R77965 TaxID=3093872 RepID=UPI0037DDC4DD